jgi:hypothetical protein
MKNLSIKLYLIIAVLLGSASVGVALPDCPSDVKARWHNCFGTFIFGSDTELAGDKYV